MKKALIVLAAVSAAGAASAQSSVTLSGTIDVGVRRVNGDYNVGGSSTTNRIIFSGREDLGGGTYAIFSLQHRFNPQNGSIGGTTFNQGANSNVFWRESWVGVGGSFGDIRLGRIIMPLQDMNGGFEPWGVTTVSSIHTGGINATIRGNNVIYYRSPNMSGFSLHAAIAAAEGQISAENGGGIASAVTPTGFQNRERPTGFNLRYAAGPLNVGVAYDRNAADMKTQAFYGSYDFGSVKLMGQFEKGDNYTSNAGTVPEDITNMSLGVIVPVGSLEVRAGLVRVNSDLTNRDGSKLGLGAHYWLSKRTNLYTGIGKSSGDRFTDAQKKTNFDVGVMHRF